MQDSGISSATTVLHNQAIDILTVELVQTVIF